MDFKDKLFILRDNYSAISDQGKSIQSTGNSIVKFANLGSDVISYLLTEQTNLDFNIPVFKVVEQSIDYMIAETNHTKSILYQMGVDLNAIESRISSGSLAGTSAVNLYASVAPSYNNIELSSPTFNYQSIQDELDLYLSQINPDYVTRRRGSWDAFYSNSVHNLSQASNSLRDLLRIIISDYASNDDVKKAEWWSYAADTENGVSLKQRLKFLIYGTTLDKIDESYISLLSECHRHYDILNQSAHGSDKDKESVENALHFIESFLLAVLKLKRYLH